MGILIDTSIFIAVERGKLPPEIFENNERMPALDIDEVVARENARLRAGLESQGKMIGINDSWIAATALAYGLKVVTRNEGEFNRVPGLVVEVW